MSFSKKGYEKIKGVDLYYEYILGDNANEKPVLVFLHGVFSSLYSFRKLIPLLEKHYPVLLIDVPPFGQSDKTMNFRYSYENLANLMVKLIERLHIKRTIFVGHSMGGQISLYAAKQHKERIEKLILLCSSAYLPRFNRRVRYASYLPLSTLYIKQKLEKQGVEYNLNLCVHNKEIIDQTMIEGYSKQFSDTRIFSALKKFIRDREGDLTTNDLKNIQIPTLLVWGKEDKVVSVDKGIRLHNDLQYSTLIKYDKAGHLLPEEVPERLANDILIFIEDKSPAPRLVT